MSESVIEIEKLDEKKNAPKTETTKQNTTNQESVTRSRGNDRTTLVANCCALVMMFLIPAVVIATLSFLIYWLAELVTRNRINRLLIPFPAISVCSSNKVSKMRLKASLYENPKFDNVPYESIMRTLSYMTKMNTTVRQEKDLTHLANLYREANSTSAELFELLKNSVPSCSDIVRECSWLDDSKSCHDYLDLVPTENGFCCVFNGANHFSDSDLDNISKQRSLLHVKDEQNCSSFQLALTLADEIDDYALKNEAFNDFKVLVHSPNLTFPDVDGRGFYVKHGLNTSVEVKSFASDVMKNAKALPRNERICKTSDDGSIPYSQSDCIMKCASRIIKESFHCQPYFLHAETATPLCDLELFPSIQKKFSDVKRNPEEHHCGCLRPCEDTWILPKISTREFTYTGIKRRRTNFAKLQVCV